MLLKYGADTTAKAANGLTAAFYATRHVHSEVVAILRQHEMATRAALM